MKTLGSRRRSAIMKALKRIETYSSVLALAAIAALASAATAPAAEAEAPAGLAWTIELAPAAPQLAEPPLPPPGVYPVQLVIDDDSAEGNFGVADANGARQFLWFNRFTPPGQPFDLAEVWVLFPAVPNVSAGDPVQIAVYLDPDGDPTNGAELLATYDETIQVADGNTFSIYPVAVPILEPGDVLIGVVPRFLAPGDPPTGPAAFDVTTNEQRSWVAIWTGAPPDPPTLPPDLLIERLDVLAPAAAGNWMIRGFGVPAPAVVIPALDGFGLALLALALAAAGWLALRRRGRSAAGALGVVVLAATALLASEPASAQVVIDDFSTAQATISDPPGGGSTATTAGSDILGGKRGLLVRNLAGPGPTSAGVAGGALDFSIAATTPDSLGEADVIWDGDADNDPSTFDPTGFGTPVDLTDGGTQGAFRITVEQAEAGTHLVLTVYEDANLVSRAGRVLPAIASATDVFISFAELIADPDAAGPADLSLVGAITLRIGGSETASPPVVSLAGIATAGPNVAAAKVDTVGGVIVNSPQTPGTTLRYRVTIDNPGAGAAEAVDFDDAIADPNLGTPSNVRTTPLARRDQYVTFTNGEIDSAVDGLPSLLANDADPDGDPLATVAAGDQVTAQGGNVSVGTDGHFVYTPPAGFVGVDAFNYVVAATAGDPTADAAGDPIGTIQGIAYVAIDRVPPEIVAGGTLLYTENDGPQPIDPALTVTDDDSVNLFGATVEISGNYVPGEDVLGFTNTANITGVFVPATGVLTLTGTDTVAGYQAALRSVTYENTSEDPSELDRTVTWTATDGGETSAPATSTIEVTSVNDAPIVTTTGGTADFVEDGGPVVIDGALTVTDADDTTLASATVTITNLLDAGLETLAANTGGTSITALYSAPTLTLTGPDTVANFQQVLRTVTYDNASQDPDTTDRQIQFVAIDGTDPSVPAFKTVTVTPQNDPPVAGDDLWQTIGNTRLVVDLPALPHPHVRDTTAGAADGVLDNDADPVEGDNVTVSGVVGCGDLTSPFDCPTANGGTVSLDAAGTFTYTPAAGDTAASDSFQYTLTDDGFPAPASDVGTVTIQRFERVWYVDNDAAPGGNGTSGSPFTSLAALNGAGGAGDSDSPNDHIFVHFGDGLATGQAAGLVLENGQHLLGEHAGLSIPVDLNGNGSPTVLHPGTPGSRPLISHTGAGNSAISASNAIPAQIRGLRLSSAAESAIDLTTLAAFAGSGTLAISDNVIDAVAEGLDLNHGGTGAINLALHDNSVGTGLRGLDVARTGAGSLTLTRFDDNVVSGNVTGSGIEVAGAVFDATPGLPIQQVSGGVTLIGQSGNGTGTHGLLLNNVTGSLGFTDLDVFNDGGTGLRAASTGALNAGTGAGFFLGVPPAVATIDSAGGPAVDVSGASITLPLAFLESTASTTTGLSLVNAFGGAGQTALSVSAGQISDPVAASGDAVVITGGNGNVSLGIPVTNSSGRAVVIGSRTGDTIAFTGAIAETGSGLSMTNNGGATISYRGGLTASTGTSAAFTATGGGNVELCDENPCNPGATGGLVNTLTTTTGTALNVANTTITANRIELRSVSSNGGSNGIVLNSTGSQGGLSIKGTGSAGSGGTIQNKTIGISLTSTQEPSFSWMQLNDFGDFAIRGHQVVGLTLANSVINGTNGNDPGADEGSVRFTDLTGSASVTNTSVSGAVENNFAVVNSNGTLNRITFTGATFGPMSVTDGNDGLVLESLNAAVINATVQNSAFTHARGDLFNFLNNGTGTNDLVFTGNTLTNAHPAIATGGGGVTISGGDLGGSMTFDISGGNTFRDSDGHAILIVKSTGAGTYEGTFANNTIGVAAVPNSGSVAGSGLKVQNAGGGAMTIAITGNTVRNYNNFGIELLTGGGASPQSGQLNATVTGNTVGNPGTGGLPMNGIHLNGGTVPGDTYQICLEVGGAGGLANSIAGSGANVGTDIRLRQRQSTTVQLRGYAGGNTDVTAVQNYLIAQNSGNGAPTALASTQSPPGGGFVNTPGGGPCPQP